MLSLFQVPAALHTLSHLLLTTLYLRYYYTHLIVEDLRSEKSNNLPKSHRWRVQSIRCSCQCFMLCPIVSSSGLDATSPHKSGTVISLVAQGIWDQEGKSAAKKVSLIGRSTHSHQSSCTQQIFKHYITPWGCSRKQERQVPAPQGPQSSG